MTIRGTLLQENLFRGSKHLSFDARARLRRVLLRSRRAERHFLHFSFLTDSTQ